MDLSSLVSHRAYGYTVLSNRRIVGLTAAPPGPGETMEVRLQDVPDLMRHPVGDQAPAFYVSPFQAPGGDPMLRAWWHGSAECYRLRHWDGTECVVHQSGRQIWMTWPGRVLDPEEFLLGTGLGFALRLRGELCLHASAVAIAGRAVLLAGPSGSGKSTVAALLGLRGHAVITDDMSVVTRSPGGFSVQAGAARLRLRREAASIVDDQARRDLSWVPSPDEAYVDLTLDQPGLTQPSAATALEAIYFLEPDPQGPSHPRLEDVAPPDALMALVADSWAARLQDRAMRTQEFERVSDLVGSISLKRIRFRPGPHAGPLIDLIVVDRHQVQVSPR